MSATFAELFEGSFQKQNLHPGAVITAKVLDVTDEHVVVDTGLKSESYIPLSQFKDDDGQIEVKAGDSVEVALEMIEDGWGEPRLSREKAKRVEAWARLVTAHEKNEIVKGVISHKVRGGFTVEVQSIRAFLPGSQVDVRPVRDSEPMEGKVFEFKVIKIDPKRNNVVVSRRSVLENDSDSDRQQLLQTLEEGQEVKGIVKNLTDYGAFVDLGGVDGLLHITDMAWKRVKHPNEVVEVGKEILVKILKFDREKSRVSLGLKQLGSDPWTEVTHRFPVSSRLKGKVTSVTDYGCFVEIEEGVEGLVHVSEMDWTNKNIHPSKVVQFGDMIEVMVLDIDEERRRVSLGLKQCQENPWDSFSAKYNKNDRIKGKIKSITDFGLFIGLDNGIDGLVHLSDLSWEDSGEQALRNYKKGDEVEALVLAVDVERERISLGIKQLSGDAFTEYTNENGKGSVVMGEIIAVEPKFATVKLADQIEAQLRNTEISAETNPDLTTELKVGEQVEAKIISIDRKSRVINISIKAKEVQEEKEALTKLRKESKNVNPTLGDLIKESMNSSSDNQDTESKN